MEKGHETLKVPVGEDLPNDFKIAVDEMQSMNHSMFGLYAALVAALALLAAFPMKRSATGGC